MQGETSAGTRWGRSGEMWASGASKYPRAEDVADGGEEEEEEGCGWEGSAAVEGSRDRDGDVMRCSVLSAQCWASDGESVRAGAVHCTATMEARATRLDTCRPRLERCRGWGGWTWQLRHSFFLTSSGIDEWQSNQYEHPIDGGRGAVLCVPRPLPPPRPMSSRGQPVLSQMLPCLLWAFPSRR